MGFLTFITIVLAALKVFGVIAWSWWIVAIPLGAYLGFYIVVGGFQIAALLCAGGVWAIWWTLSKFFTGLGRFIKDIFKNGGKF